MFLASALGVIPTAALMGRATEEVAARSRPGIGGFRPERGLRCSSSVLEERADAGWPALNVTFGNAPELIIALFALGAVLHEVVKASLVGSIVGNILLVMGASMLTGGARRDRQDFEPRAASAQALLVMPAIFELVQVPGLPLPRDRAIAYPADALSLSVGVAVVLLFSYAAALLFSLKTHAHLFNRRTRWRTTEASPGRCFAA